ncbi:hypothetical protein [Helicobacter sp.]|uniref:hypothetical protein n=1 Tax=Helicobacter sp. TaxID=218 RepID=UPI0025B849CE|nr:hypothetical protein [Helicobacter sp.]MCI5967936.1 hypothetical protein [Helicobacter sp.]MDY2585298.1 hypothetical protein [Helicobacter sp.]
MKIALICDSLLLDRSLEMYLKEYLTSYKLCDFVVATQFVESQKPVFLIGDMEGAHLKIPFTKELLLKELEFFYYTLKDGSQRNSKEAILPSIDVRSEEIHSLNTDTDSLFLGDLNIKMEEILKRYAKEIETTILEHLKEKRG